MSDQKYLQTEGKESYWYWAGASDKSIAFYNIPDTDGRVWNFDYEKSVSVTSENDDLPFQNEQEAQSFVDMASRRFKYIIEERDLENLYNDNEYLFNQSSLMNFIRHNIHILLYRWQFS